MSGTDVGGVQKISEEDLKALGGDPTNVSDEQLEAMAAKSGDTVEHMREILGLYKKDEGQGDANAGGDAGDKLLAGKYKNEEDLDKGFQSLVEKYGKEKAYKMLEGNLGKQGADDNTDTGDNTGTKDALSTDDDAGNEGDAGDQKTDMQKFYDEFADSGELSIDSYKELADLGFDKDLVDGYIEGQAARVTMFTNSVHEVAGGEEQFDNMVEWGSQNLSKDQKVKFNDAVNSGNLELAKDVINALKYRYLRAEGTFKRGGIESSGNADGSTNQGYASVSEWQAAMRDPRYKTDPAYVADVGRKLKLSKI